MRRTLIIAITSLLALGVYACAGKQPDPDAPLLARDCLWVLWIKDQIQAREAAAQVTRGRNLIMVGREFARQGADKATLETGCPTLSELPLGVVEAARPLALGQVSQPFDLRGGTALVMRGSERHRQQAQAHYAAKRYQEAQEAALHDLALNPSSTASWLLLGNSRLALGDQNGALRAYDTGLLIDYRDLELQRARGHLLGQPRGMAQPETPAATAPPAPSAGTPPPPGLVSRPLTPPSQPGAAPAGAPAAPVAAPSPNPPPALTVGAPPEASSEDALEARQLLDSAKHASQSGRDPEQVEAQARRAIKLDPKLAGAWLLLAQVQEGKKQYAEATMSYHQAASLDSTLDEANVGLRRSFTSLDKERVSRLGEQPARQPIARDTLPDAPKRTIARGTLADAATPPSQAGKAAEYFVQVASIQNPSVAQQEVRKWSGKGYASRAWAWKGPDGGTWQRVLLGPYPSRDQAQGVGQKLKAQGEVAFFSVVDLPRR